MAVLGFGLPVFLLPQRIEEESVPAKAYNKVFGSDTYNEYLRPVVSKALGGALRLFVRETPHQYLGGSARRTLLSVRGQLYEGTTLEQANDIAMRLENRLAGYKEIEQFQTNVYGSGSIAMQIYFKKEHEFTPFPESLKSELESKVVEMGAGDWTITGVGRGFDNSLHEGARNSRVTFYGYNMEALKGFAGKFKRYLLEIQRVDAKSIFINGRATYDDRVHTEHLVDLRKERLLRAGIPEGRMLAALRELSQEETRVLDLYREGSRESVVLKASRSKLPDYWQFYNQALEIEMKVDQSYAYLTVFDNRQWEPIAFGDVKRNKVQFMDMCRNIVYLPVYCTSTGLEPLNFPFILEYSDQVRYLIPDTTRLNPIVLTRKYPVFNGVYDMTMRTVGAKLQASGTEDFKNAVTVRDIDEWHAAGIVQLPDSFPVYRYWRFRSPDKEYCNIAELMFFCPGDTIPRSGKVIGLEEMYKNDSIYSKEKAFDHDPLTYFHSVTRDSA